MVVAIDAKRENAGYAAVSASASQGESVELEEHLRNCEDAGSGEFLIQSIDNDGMMEGFDLDLLSLACAVTRVPVIGCGGAGQYNYLKEAFLETDVSAPAVACNFSDSNPLRAKAFSIMDCSLVGLIMILQKRLKRNACSCEPYIRTI